ASRIRARGSSLRSLRRPLRLRPATLAPLALAPLAFAAALAQDKDKSDKPAEPPSVEVAYDLSGVVEPAAEPGPDVDLQDGEEDETRPFAIGARPTPGDLGDQLKDALATLIPGVGRDDDAVTAPVDLGARSDRP